MDSVVELHEAVQETSTLPSEDVAELLDEDKCFSLTKPDEGAADEACSIRLSCAHSSPWLQADGSAGEKKTIKAVLLHSEARVVEICVGTHDEYLKTVHGKRLGQYEDTEMCACLVELNPPRQEVLLTLKHTYNPECVWVFGLLAVTTQEHKAEYSESRFSGARLSSVLKDKEVNMSKDAARFLHLLESYNASNHASGQSNENNQLALMSMFLGPKMLSKGHLAPGMLSLGGGDGSKGGTIGKGRLNKEENKASGHAAKVDDGVSKGGAVIKGDLSGEESQVGKDHNVISKLEGLENDDANEIENRMKNLGIRDEENNQTNQDEEPANEGKKNDNSIYSKLYKEPVTPRPQTIPSAIHQDRMIEKLFSLMGNTRQGTTGPWNMPGQYAITKPETPATSLTPGLSEGHFPLSPPQSAASQGHSASHCNMTNALMDSLGQIFSPPHNNNFQSPHSFISGPTHSTPRSREAENNNGIPDNSCDGGLGLQGRRVFLREVESMIEEKFVQLEERLTKRVEEKLAEKAQRDSERLEKIEEQLSKLCEHLLR